MDITFVRGILMWWFSLARLLWFIGLFAVGLASLRNSSTIWNEIVFTLALGALFSGLLGAILLGRRGWSWIGYALFGWGYFLFGYLPGQEDSTKALPRNLGMWVFSMTNSRPVAPPNNFLQDPMELADANEDYDVRSRHSETIGFWIFDLFFAQSGALLGGYLARRQAGSTSDATFPLVPR